jgi:hypothetical protein
MFRMNGISQGAHGQGETGNRSRGQPGLCAVRLCQFSTTHQTRVCRGRNCRRERRSRSRLHWQCAGSIEQIAARRASHIPANRRETRLPHSCKSPRDAPPTILHIAAREGGPGNRPAHPQCKRFDPTLRIKKPGGYWCPPGDCST